MSTLLLTTLRIGFLALLWIFVIFVVLLVRRDVYGPHIRERKPRKGKTSNPIPRKVAQSHSNPPSLVVTEGPLTGTTLPLGRSDIIVGRSPDSALVLDDTYSSSRHARFYPAQGAWWVEDLQSTNGTFVNGKKITAPTQLRPGLPVMVGRTTIELRP